jgi:hypothetical protein
VWDFLEGRRDILCQSVVPFLILDVKWNPYLANSNDEFASISENMYHYWRITSKNQMQYQNGKMPPKFEGKITSVSYVEPMFE